MDKQILQFLIPGIGLISGLIATYVSLQNRALLAEVRKELVESEYRIILKINGTYVRRGECELQVDHIHEKLEELTTEVRGRNAQR